MATKPTTEAEKKAAEDLAKKETVTSKKAADVLAKLKLFQLRAIACRELLAKSMTSSVGSGQAGRRSKRNTGVVHRGLRSMKAERERQLLKQASTQIYFSLAKYLKKKKDVDGKLVEVEMMHLQYGKKSFVFVAANEKDVPAFFEDFVGGKNRTPKKVLTTTYQPNRSVEGKRRSKLYAKKLQRRLFDDEINLPVSTKKDDGDRAVSVAEELRGDWKSVIFNERRIKKVIDANDGGVFFVDTSRYSRVGKARHAEEFLVDVAEFVKKHAAKNNVDVSTTVAGKKRPCMSCSGRMKGVIDRYGPRPGLLWLHTVGRQKPAVARRTYATVLSKPSYVTEDGRGLKAADFDSGSDSDGEAPTP